jgi:hypothetical protein
MNPSTRAAQTEPAKRTQLRGRAQRGIVAGYVHELSERHAIHRRVTQTSGGARTVHVR